MVKENWMVGYGWKKRQQAKNAVIKKDNMVLIPHPRLPKTWIEVDGEKKKMANTEQILQEVSEYSGVPVKDIMQKTRDRYYLEPRQIVHYLARAHTRESLFTIGLKTGGFDHATIIHSIKTVKALMKTSREYREKWAGLINS